MDALGLPTTTREQYAYACRVLRTAKRHEKKAEMLDRKSARAYGMFADDLEKRLMKRASVEYATADVLTRSINALPDKVRTAAHETLYACR